jgi:DNA polymerase-3 subunit beta
MKFSCLQENLVKALSMVSRAVASRSTLPVLSNVLLTTDGSQIKLSATNLELSITYWLDAHVEEPGTTTVPARTFAELVGTMPQDRVDLALNTESQTLNIRCGSYNSNLKCISAEDYPIIVNGDESEAIELSATDLRRLISHVTFAAATEDTRPVLTGVEIKLEHGEMTFAAADGYRLAVQRGNLDLTNAHPIRVIVPAKALNELAKLVSDQDAPVLMMLPANRSQVIFRCKNVELISQLIEGSFPDYNQLIPQNARTRAVVSTAALRNACKAARIFARDAAFTTRFKISPSVDNLPGSILIRATSAETGSNEIMLDANVEGEPIEIAFNVGFVGDVLNVIDTPNVLLEMNGPNKPGVLRPAGQTDSTNVIMPMSITN